MLVSTAPAQRLTGLAATVLLLGVGTAVGQGLRLWWADRPAEPVDGTGRSVAAGPAGEGTARARPARPEATSPLDRLDGPAFDPSVPFASPGRGWGRLPNDSEGGEHEVAGDADPGDPAGGVKELDAAADADAANAAAERRSDDESWDRRVEGVRAAVVGVTTLHRRSELAGLDEEGYGDLDGLPPSVGASSFGTGVLYDAEGLVLTALHVVAEPEQILVRLPGRGMLEAQLVGADPSTDLAVLRIDRLAEGTGSGRFQAAELARGRAVTPGDLVFALRHREGAGLERTVGSVDQVGRHLQHATTPENSITNEYLEFGAEARPGSSGSPVFDLRGRLVGLLTRASRSGDKAYALTARTVRKVLAAMERGGGRVERAHLGASLAPVSGATGDEVGRFVPEGGAAIRIESLGPGYAADRGGLLPGDLLVRANGRPIESAAAFHDWITWSGPGTRVRLEIVRGGAPLVKEIELGRLGDPPGGAEE